MSLFYSCESSPKNIDLTEYNVRGKVKSIREESFYFSKEGDREDSRQTLVSFDLNVHITEQIIFQPDGSIMLKTTTKYYDTYRMDSTYDNRNVLMGVRKKVYNDQGLLIREHSTNKMGNYPKNQFNIAYKYDNNNNLIEKVEYNDKRKLTSKEEYKYNTTNKLVEIREYNSLNQCEGYDTYKYDRNGNKIESKYYNFFSRKFTYIHAYQYNDKGDVTREISNNLAKNESYSSDMSYEYDINENWTKKVSKAQTYQHIVTRKITYQ